MLAFVPIFLSVSALAVEHRIGPQGGLFCEDAHQLAAYALAASKGLNPGPEGLSSCFVLAAGTTVDLESQTTFDGVQYGVATALTPRGVRVAGGFVAPVAPAPAPTPPPASWTGVRNYKTVSPEDVRATPKKWSNRYISFKSVQVYWVEDNDVRLLTSASLTLFARSVKGDARLVERLKHGCETVREALSRTCRVSVRFAYENFNEDTPTGLVKRTVLEAAEVELVAVGR